MRAHHFGMDYPVELIEQLEILKGASSALYGSSALNGVVHIVTKEASNQPITKLSTSLRQVFSPENRSAQWWDRAPTRFHFSAAHTRKIGETGIAASAYYVDEKSHIEPNEEQYGRLFFKASRFLGKSHKIGLQTSWNNGEASEALFWLDDSSGIYQSAGDGDIVSSRERWVVSPSYSFIGDNQSLHFKGQYLKNNNPGTENRSIRSDMLYGDLHYVQQLGINDGSVIMGTSYLHADAQAELYQNADIFSQNFSAYTQFQISIGKLNFNAGLRYELFDLNAPDSLNSSDVSNQEDRIIGRFGSSVTIAPTTVLRASWGQGFRFPAIAERYISTNIGATIISPNPDLKAETGHTFEVGLKQIWQLGKLRGLLDAAVFHSRYDNMIEFVFTGFINGFQSQNIGNTEINGLDITLAFENNAKKGVLQGFVAYQHLNPTYRNFSEDIRRQSTSLENILKYRSTDVLKGDIQYQIGKWGIGTNYQYNSGIESIDAVFELLVPGLINYRRAPQDFHLWQLRTSYLFNSNLNLTLILDNVLNESYSLRPGVEESPMSLSIRLETEW